MTRVRIWILLWQITGLLALSVGASRADAGEPHVVIHAGDQEYRRIRIDVTNDEDEQVHGFEIWYSGAKFESIEDARLHSFILVGDTSGLERVEPGDAYDDCWSDSLPIHRNAASTAVIANSSTAWSCKLTGMTPGVDQWIAVIPVDASGRATIDTSSLSAIVGRTDAADERTAPPNTRPIAFALSSIVLAAVLLLLFLRWRDAQRGRSRSRLAHIYVAPALIALAALTFYPILYGIWLAFTDADQSRLGDESWIGFANFVTVFTSPGMWRVTIFTMIWAVANVVAHVVLGLGLALALNRAGLIGKNAYRTVLLLPWAIPAYISVLAWRGMLQPEGLVNSVLGTNIDFLTDIGSARALVILVNVWLGVPFMMMTLTGALQALSTNIFEAAEVDGVSRWDQFLYLTLPNLKSTLVPVSLLSLIFTFNNFGTIYLMTRGDPVVGFGEPGSTDILVTYVFRVAFEYGYYGIAAAWSVIIFLMLVSFSWFYMTKTRATEANA